MTPQAGTARETRLPTVIDALARRWPMLLALTMAAISWGSTPTKRLSEAVLLFAFGYLVAAVLQRRQATWLIAVAVIGGFAVVRLQDWIDPAAVLLIVAVVLVGWGAVRGLLWPPGELMLQTVGMIGFATLALTALAVDLDVARYLLAAGWIGHAAWDFAHWRADKVVSRSFAEWCGVFDLAGGIGILLLPMA
jgi:hypothetical protein